MFLAQLTPARVGIARARGYKEKHKLDSKLISDSAFRTHLSFCKNREIINLSDLTLKTQEVGAVMQAVENVPKIGTQ